MTRWKVSKLPGWLIKCSLLLRVKLGDASERQINVWPRLWTRLGDFGVILCEKCVVPFEPGGRFNITIPSHQYKDPHHKYKMRILYLERRPLYWNGPMTCWQESEGTGLLYRICKVYTGLALGLCSANETRRYKVTPPLIGWAQT